MKFLRNIRMPRLKNHHIWYGLGAYSCAFGIYNGEEIMIVIGAVCISTAEILLAISRGDRS